jgi:predicted permease
MSNVRFLDSGLFDARFALRQLRKTPGFTITVILTLALGIGAATAMFVVGYGVLLQPLPFPNSERLYQPVGIDALGKEDGSAPYSAIERWRDVTRKSAEISLWGNPQGVLDTPSGAKRINNVQSSLDLLSTLGVQPVLGRGFVPEEGENGKSHVVILSYSIWHEAFSADPGILGRSVYIDGEPFDVIGVMPKGFMFPVYKNQEQVWTPFENARLFAASASNPYDRFDPIVRVRGGIDPLNVQAEISNVQSQLAKAAGAGQDPATHIRLVPLRDTVVGEIQPAMRAMEIAVGLVWFIACCNVAGLLLARIAGRRSEIAVRSALGASRRRIVMQFLTESLLLSLASAALGVTLALLMLRSAQHIIERSLPLPVSFSLNWPLLSALVAFSLLTALAFGVFPAAFATRLSFAEVLKNRSQAGGSDRGHSRFRGLLVIAEVAVSVTLLIAAGLMLRTLHSLEHVPLGFRTDHIVMTDLTLPGHLYKDSNVATSAWKPLLERVQHLPGVRAAALSTVLPIGHPVEWLTLIYKTSWTNGNEAADVRAASPDVMQVLGIRLLRGRFITLQDVHGSLPVAVVNQTFVDQYLGGRDAVGKQIRFGRIPSTATIVGVLADVRQDAVSMPSKAELYISMAQLKPGDALYLPLIGQSMQLAVRTQANPDGMIPEVSRAIREENPHLLISHISTMNQSVEDSIGTQRLIGGLTGTFSGLALLITAVGLYGLLSFTVSQRTREIGIRMALGAGRRQLTSMVIGQSFLLMIAGITIGISASLWANRFLKSFLYGVSSHDPWMITLGPVILLAFGTIAAVLPARRAASVDPMQALRSDT